MWVGIFGGCHRPKPPQQRSFEFASFRYPILVNVIYDVSNGYNTSLGPDGVHVVKLGQLFENEDFRLVERDDGIKGRSFLHDVQHNLKHGDSEDGSFGRGFGNNYPFRWNFR